MQEEALVEMAPAKKAIVIHVIPTQQQMEVQVQQIQETAEMVQIQRVHHQEKEEMVVLE